MKPIMIHGLKSYQVTSVSDRRQRLPPVIPSLPKPDLILRDQKIVVLNIRGLIPCRALLWFISVPTPSSMTSLKPLIAICGTTGVGKSKLSVELALKLGQEIYQGSSGEHQWRGGRIINADSMQIYTGMDIITNKIPQTERMGVEHLLMDFKQPGEQYVVGQWVQDAIEVVSINV
jgi:hypothetical protein